MHCNNSYLGVIDQKAKKFFKKKLSNDLETVVAALTPYTDKLEGIAVESTFNSIDNTCFFCYSYHSRSLKMRILISDIPEEGLDIAVDERIEADYPRLVSPVKAIMHIEKIGEEVILRGRISNSVELICSRCLKDFEKDLDIDVDVVYHSVSELKEEEIYEIKEDELDTGFYFKDEIDLNELMLEQIILNIPMKPLCSESCKGLCPKCGKDLNIESCDCETKGIDPRFEKLKKLFNDRKE